MSLTGYKMELMGGAGEDSTPLCIAAFAKSGEVGGLTFISSTPTLKSFVTIDELFFVISFNKSLKI